MMSEEIKKQKVTLVCDRPGQISCNVMSKREGRLVRTTRWAKVGELFELEVPVAKDGKPIIPQWAHEPDKDEKKNLEDAARIAHAEAGAVNAVAKKK